jgi:signal transduction histidine kinase
MSRPEVRGPTPALMAWSIWALVLGIALATPLLMLLFHSVLGASPVTAGIELLGVASASIGALVASRLPRNPVGWLFLAAGFLWTADQTAGVYAADAGVLAPGSLPGAIVAAWLQWSLWLPALVLLLGFTPLLFPNGHLPSSRWRIPAFLLGTVGTTAVSAQAVDGLSRLNNGLDPTGSLIGDPAPAVSALGSATMVLVLVAVASLAARFRGAGGEMREQLKWFAYAAAVTAVVAIASLVSSLIFPGSQQLSNVGILASIVTMTGIPVAAGIAILRYRLYDIDVVISRTLVYGSLAAFITSVYVAIVVGVGTLVGSGGQPNLVLSIVATAVVAVAFQPVRERLQKVANRMVYGKRATPYEVLSQFSERVAESYAADDVLPRMAHVLADGTGAVRADVWLRAGQLLRPAASWPEGPLAAEPALIVGDSVPGMPEADRVVEVWHQGELLGALSVTKRVGESLTPVEEKLLDDLASQAGLVLKNVGLTAELMARLEDLRASRQRLVAAQDEERRRLERNLHDGAQQNLVALKVKLGLAEMLAEKDPAKAKELVGQLKSDADEALETLRDLARGIYPPLLADKGLVVALEAQARKATAPVEVVASGLSRYPPETEAAVYFCCLEALQNVQKYASADLVVVTLKGSGGHLDFAVSDDGLGFDSTLVKRGAGLTNMADRIDALGGTLEVASAPGDGTSVTGSVPVLPGTPPTDGEAVPTPSTQLTQ